MSRKLFTQSLLIIAILFASFASAVEAQASSNCGSTYTVQWGDTLSQIANYCDVTLASLYAANPGLGYYIYPGQVLVIPASGIPQGFSNTYVVRSGDTFASIAAYYGVNIYTLWAANPQIWNINWIYTGQVIYVPGSGPSWPGTTASYDTPEQLSYGSAPAGTPKGRVRLYNNANADVYVSLQGTTNDGVTVINEYTVDGSVIANVPVGWYIYVVWAGGKKFSGQFQLRGDETVDLLVYANRATIK